MSQHDEIEYQLDTLAIRTGHDRTFEGEHSEPIFLTSSFVCENAADAAAKFSGEIAGNTYSRYTNPTVQAFEKRLAILDGAERAVATSSGMAAVHAICLASLKAGDHVICSRAAFGSIISLFEKYVVKFGVDVTYVELENLDAWKQAVRPNTKLVFIETPSNPLAQVGDMQAIADGVRLEEGVAEVDAISYIDGKPKNEIGIEIHIGWNRVVRRIFQKMGYEVEALDRVMFAGLTKKNVKRGYWRILTDLEVNNLKML